MHDYNRRIAERYNRTVVSLAVLADDDPSWRPARYEEELWGWWVGMGWPPLKLLDFADKVAQLEESKNPFAKVVLAHLKALETRQDPNSRRTWKLRLVRGLYERGFSNEDVRQLFRVIDWLMVLPRRVHRRFERELDEYEEGRRMPYVTSIERSGMLKMLEVSLRTRFGDEGAQLIAAIEELDDAEKFLALNRVIINAETLDEVRRACAKAGRRKKDGNGKRGSGKTK
jgi:hypothetical protein